LLIMLFDRFIFESNIILWRHQIIKIGFNPLS